MEVTTKAVALKATDYKENDKHILLYSLEYGKISILARGIRKSSAKLRFAADQFCFGQYDLAQVGDRFTLKTCEQLESFYSLREDIVAYYAACTVAECLINYTEEGQSEPPLFVEMLKAFEVLSCGTNPLLVTLRFMLKFFELHGIKLQLDADVVEDSSLSPRALTCCKMVDNIDYNRLANINVSDSILKETLSVCFRYISNMYFPLKSLSELLKLI